MGNPVRILLFVATLSGVIACNKGYPGGYGHGAVGWGAPPVFVLKKPTFFPKLKQAYLEGKYSVNVHKIIAPSLKPLPYSKKYGWLKKYKGWGNPYGHIGHIGYGLPHVGYGHGFGYGHGGHGVGHGIGAGLGHGLGHGHIGHGPIVAPGPIGLGHGAVGLGHGAVGLGHSHVEHVEHNVVSPVPPIGPHGHHHVSEHAVTVVEKGLPGAHHPSLTHDK